MPNRPPLSVWDDLLHADAVSNGIGNRTLVNGRSCYSTDHDIASTIVVFPARSNYDVLNTGQNPRRSAGVIPVPRRPFISSPRTLATAVVHAYDFCEDVGV